MLGPSTFSVVFTVTGQFSLVGSTRTRLSSTRVSSGQLVSSVAPATLITMVYDSDRRARTIVVERNISRICPGEHGEISVAGVCGDQFEGRIEMIAPDVTENS
jgi:hypothetical protein